VIGVAIPAHEERAHIAAAVAAVQVAARHPALQGEAVEIVVVADACSDGTAACAAAQGAHTLSLTHRNVGQARQAGAELLLARGARWLAFTDADSLVADDWIAAQLGVGAQAVCGCVWVRDWSAHGALAGRLARAFDHHYRPVDGHRHIHGANLGMTAEAYRLAGGFAPLRSSEDVALVQALEDAGVPVVFSARPRVWTSARTDPRAPGGFGVALRSMSQALVLPPGAPVGPRAV
jgi:glycosyltransferase involved in cell wall biosynthesis